MRSPRAAITITGILVLSSLCFSQQGQQPQPDISELQKKAEAGDPAAELALGQAYQHGKGVEQNDETAVEWYRKAAAAGEAEAENDLGVMYMNGWGIEKNKQTAIEWYRKAARQKNAHAISISAPRITTGMALE